jgi:threonine dehydrogenase-like Zn-dependent dehydrogenase
MKGTVLYGPRDVRFEDRPEPRIEKPTDAIIRISATCVCGSDLWPYRGIQSIAEPTPMGHEYCGIVEEVGSEVKRVKPPVGPRRPVLIFNVLPKLLPM